MKIGSNQIGDGHPAFFIAEAGVNHNGQLDLAEDLIDVAATAGADAVKFQTFSTDRLVSQDASKAEYQKVETGEGGQYEMLKKYELDRDEHERLRQYCSEQDITFLSTPFDIESAELLVELGVPAIKIGSGELNNLPFLKKVAGLDLPLIVSTGMGTMEEVQNAYEVITSVESNPDLVFLHCTSAYPASVEDVNLRAMKKMDAELPVLVGYSDHTTLPEMPAMAVAAGASIVEKHFTVDASLPGPDHAASLEPDELAKAVELVNVASTALGNEEKKPVNAEMENRTIARKSLHAAVDLAPGSTLAESDIKIIRPASGISPVEFENVVGVKTNEFIAKGDPIQEDMLDFGP